MTTLLYSDRIGKTAHLRVACVAAIFDTAREKLLLTRRADNGQWCLPGGRMEPGESATEACVREIWEETGLEIALTRLIGIYTTPHRITLYPGDDRVQFVGLLFEASVTGGQLGLSNETTEFGYFTQAEIAALDLMEHHRIRIEDAFTGQIPALIR